MHTPQDTGGCKT